MMVVFMYGNIFKDGYEASLSGRPLVECFDYILDAIRKEVDYSRRYNTVYIGENFFDLPKEFFIAFIERAIERSKGDNEILLINEIYFDYKKRTKKSSPNIEEILRKKVGPIIKKSGATLLPIRARQL